MPKRTPKATESSRLEEPKRLAHTKAVVRHLFAHSGNVCAFPDCRQLMIDRDGDFVGQICHIEGVAPGSERHDPTMTNAQRADVKNLILLCGKHHVKTDNVSRYPVKALQDMKEKHERRFADPVRIIMTAFTDSTDGERLILPENLGRMASVLKWTSSKEQLQDEHEQVVDLLRQFEKAPPPVREFMGAVAQRMRKVRKTGAVTRGMDSVSIDISDLAHSLHDSQNKPMSKAEIGRLAEDLANYGLGNVDEHSDGPHRRVVLLYNGGERPFWLNLAVFAKKESISFDVFTRDLDFGSLGN